MKIKSLLAITLTFAAPAFSAAVQENYDSEILGGYMSVSTDGSSSYSGFNLEYRKHVNDYFGYGGALSYGSDSYSVNGFNTDSYLSAVDANVMLKMPIKSFYLYGKAGASLTGASFDTAGFVNGHYFDTTVSDTGFAPFFGVGLSVPVRDRWLFDISYTIKEPSFDFGYGVEGKAKLNSLFVQVGYKF